jgi:hypothetical protein
MITGHRNLKNRDWTKQVIDDILTKAHNKYQDNLKCLCGLALGADTIFGLLALDKGIDLWAYPSGLWQADRWRSEDKMVWEKLYHGASATNCVGETNRPYLRRNDNMVRDADVALVVWDGRRGGGTYYTMNKIIEKGIIWGHINPKLKTLRWQNQ